MSGWATPIARAIPAAAIALATLCGTAGLISEISAITSAASGNVTNARSMINSSTIPTSPACGVSNPKNILRPLQLAPRRIISGSLRFKIAV